MSATSQPVPRVVIIGGGFAGLTAARELAKAPVKVTVVDRENHHLFQPLLYQVATAALNPGDIAAPIRRVLRHQKNAEVILAEAKGIDLANREVQLSDGTLKFDYLIVATGARHAYFGHDEWMPFAPGLKSIADALDIRRRVLLAFEVAEREIDRQRRQQWLTFVIVGAGPTGVELAGALREIARHALARDFRHIDPTQAKVILLEGADRVLPTYSPETSERARKQLAKLGVDVRTKTLVTHIDADGVTAGDERIPAKTVLWAAGVAASRLGRCLDAEHDRAGRVKVNQDLTLPGHDRVYVIGDLATVAHNGGSVPGVAPAAMQEGRHAAQNIIRSLRGEPRLPFRYRDKGSLATIGRWSAVADFGRWKLSGPIAWLTWLFVHLLFLIEFRNRLIVFVHWAWSFFSYDRGSRLITGERTAADEHAASTESCEVAASR